MVDQTLQQAGSNEGSIIPVTSAREMNMYNMPQQLHLSPGVGTCPNCGYCPHCHRGGQQVGQWGPYPYWWNQVTNTAGGFIQGVATNTSNVDK